MKYNYIKPEIEVLEIEQKQVILTVSDDEEPEQSGWVGAPPVNDIDMENDDVAPVNEE